MNLDDIDLKGNRIILTYVYIFNKSFINCFIFYDFICWQ